MKEIKNYFIEITSANDLSDSLIIKISLNDATSNLRFLEDKMQGTLKFRPCIKIHQDEEILALQHSAGSKKKMVQDSRVS